MPVVEKRSVAIIRLGWRISSLSPFRDPAAAGPFSFCLARGAGPIHERFVMFKKLLLCAVAAVALSGSAWAAGVEDIPNRLKKANSGEWVLYSTMGGGANQRQTITNVEEKDGDKLFSIKAELSVDGQVMQTMDHQFSLKEAIKEQEEMTAEDAGVTISTGKDTLKGREIDVVILSSVLDGQEVKTIMSDEIPVTGILKILVDNEPLLELQDCGES